MSLNSHSNHITPTIGFLLLLLLPGQVFAFNETCKIAVASNFAATAKVLRADFDKLSGHKSLLSFGSSGKFFTQITNGAPFDVLLSADSERPDSLVKKGFALKGSGLVYAIGQLVLWSPSLKIDVSEINQLRRLVIANPKIAPYGYAAQATLKNVNYKKDSSSKLIYANNVTQVMQFVASGNADAGFLSMAQVNNQVKNLKGSWQIIDTRHYPKLEQKAVILNLGRDKACAKDFLSYLRSPTAKKVIQKMGYNLPN